MLTTAGTRQRVLRCVLNCSFAFTVERRMFWMRSCGEESYQGAVIQLHFLFQVLTNRLCVIFILLPNFILSSIKVNKMSVTPKALWKTWLNDSLRVFFPSELWSAVMSNSCPAAYGQMPSPWEPLVQTRSFGHLGPTCGADSRTQYWVHSWQPSALIKMQKVLRDPGLPELERLWATGQGLKRKSCPVSTPGTVAVGTAPRPLCCMSLTLGLSYESTVRFPNCFRHTGSSISSSCRCRIKKRTSPY